MSVKPKATSITQTPGVMKNHQAPMVMASVSKASFSMVPQLGFVGSPSPRKAREVGIEGTVVVEFVVEPNGKLSNVTAIRKVAPSLDEEAVRVVKMLPAWNPGKQMGKAVRTRFRLPIRFQLD